MSRKREPVKPLESESESGEESDDDGSSSTEPQPTQTQMQQPPSSDEEESGSESDAAQKSNTPAAKPAAAKRPAVADISTPKDVKKKEKIEQPKKKSKLFQRLFTDEDDIVLLKGMLDYAKEKNADPNANKTAFYEFVKEKLHFDFLEPQVWNKLKRMKRKLYKNMGKGKTFSKPHDQKLFDLSIKVWGNAAGKANTNKKKKAESQVKNVVAKKLNSVSGRDLYEAGLGTEGEDEWNKLRVEELKLYLKHLEVLAAQTKLVLAVVNH